MHAAHVFHVQRAIAKEKKAITERKQLTNPPTLQDVRSIQVHTMTFSQRFSSYWTSYWLSQWEQLPLNVQIKLVKTRLRSRISDSNLVKLMNIAIEGPELSSIDFKEDASPPRMKP